MALDYGTAKAADYRRLQANSLNRLGSTYGGAYDALAATDKPRLDLARGRTDDTLDTITNLYGKSLSDQETYAPATRRAAAAREQSEAMKSRIMANAVAGGGSIDDTFTRGQLGAAEGAYNAASADAFADAAEGREEERLKRALALYSLTANREGALRGDYMQALGAGSNINSQLVGGWGNIASTLQASEDAKRREEADALNALINAVGGAWEAGRIKS